MNEKQKKVVLIGILFIVLACLFPPINGYESFGFFLDVSSRSISFAKLFIECVIIVMLSLFFIFFFNKNKNDKLFSNKKGQSQSTKTDDDDTMRETVTKDILSEKGFTQNREKDIDEPKKKQLEDIPPFFTMLGIDEDCDELPNAQGEFGLVPTNPIPVNGPVGETVYINRLRSKTGVGFLYHRLGSLKSSVSVKPVDKFELVSVDATQKAILYFHVYHPRRSTKCPKDLNLLPWSQLPEKIQLFCKTNGMGITSGRVNKFPHDLPEHIENSKELASISPGLPQSMARRVKEIIDSHANQW